MDELNILIYDPDSSIFNEVISSIISDKTNHNYSIIKSLNYNNNYKTDLLILLLNQKTGVEIKDEIIKLNRKFPNRLKILIVDNLFTCEDCPIYKQELIKTLRVPFSDEELLYIVNEKQKLNCQHLQMKAMTSVKNEVKGQLLKGISNSICEIKAKISKIAPFNVNVLLIGDSGTGKELCAKMIHFLSPRSDKNFIAVNCGALPGELFENEMFGHKKGAFTDAKTDELGIVKSADKGTLFLDEIESLSNSSQVKLLRFIEEKRFKPLGRCIFDSVDIRIISAAKKNIFSQLSCGNFRSDLFYRLDVVEIEIPSLFERKEDIPILVDYFIQTYANIYGKDIKGIEFEALLKLVTYKWPGNVRELENLIQEAIISSESNYLSIGDFNFNKLKDFDSFKVDSFQNYKKKEIEIFEKSYINQILTMFNGNILRASLYSKIDRRALYNLINKYDINPSDFRN